MELAKDLGKLFGGMILVLLGFIAFGFVVYVLEYGITIPALFTKGL